MNIQILSKFNIWWPKTLENAQKYYALKNNGNY